jgi:hypothetical protein
MINKHLLFLKASLTLSLLSASLSLLGDAWGYEIEVHSKVSERAYETSVLNTTNYLNNLGINPDQPLTIYRGQVCS